MSHTVIGIFEFNILAQKAKDHLMQSGFASKDIDINTAGVAADDSLAGTADGQLPISSNEAANYVDADHNTGNNNEDNISGFFKHLFGHHDDNHQHEETLRQHIQATRRGVLVTVHTDSEEQARMAADIMDERGAVDVDEFLKKPQQPDVNTTDAAKIKIIEENLQVGKREVETGGVRLRSRIVERPVEESIRLREEHVNVERTPVNRPATEADFANFKEGTIEVTEHAERAVIAKEAHVVEEISLGKEVTEKEETIKDTVRHTEVDTENIDSKNSL